jgi:predicted metal-dependent peptidase
VHELYHLIWRHITSRRRSPNVAWNIATDLAINSIIINSRKDKAMNTKDVYTKYLPDRLYLPTVRPSFGDLKGATPEEKMVNEKYSDLIEKLPELKASEGYFSTLLDFARDNGWEWGDKGIKVPGKSFKKKGKGNGPPIPGGGQPGSGDGEGEGEGSTDEVELDSGDVHDMWDDVPDEVRDLIEGKVKGIVERAVRKADNQSNGWGSIPSEIVGEIRASVLNIINWKEVLRNFVGSTNRGHRTNTMKKINKRYPYVHPGSKRGYTPKMLVAVDQSGSVDDQSIETIFGVLRDCSKRTSFTVLPFDHTVDEKNMFEWKRGQTPAFKRVRCGGTSFQAVVDFVNKPENRGKWDAICVATDGECYKPGPCRLKMGWIIVPGRKLMFETSDLVVQMDNGKATITKGSVR